MATRWAICGTGKISNDFCISLKSLPESEHQIVAVAASSKDKADKFAATFGIPNSYGSYEDLCKLNDIDVIYIGTIHILHVEQCLMYIKAGKNVLCEKPMALTYEGCKKVLTAAKENGVLFVEATWSRFFPVYDVIRDQLKTEALGDIKMVNAHFSVKVGDVPRVLQPELGGGALMDIGLYTVQAANLVLRGKPEKITVNAVMADTGVDMTGSVTLSYSGGKMAALTFSVETQLGANSLTIRGTKGNIEIPNYMWCPTEITIPTGEKKEFPLPDVENMDKYVFTNSQGFRYEAQEVRDCLLKGLKESPRMPHEDSETIMYILKDCVSQLGIKYQHP